MRKTRKGPSLSIIQWWSKTYRNPDAPICEAFRSQWTSHCEEESRIAKHKSICNIRGTYQTRKTPSPNYRLLEKLSPTHEPTMKKEFIAEPRASMHMMSKNDLVMKRKTQFGNWKNLVRLLQWTDQLLAKEEGIENDKDLYMLITHQSSEDWPAVLSLDQLCEEHGHSYEWNEGQSPTLTKHGKLFCCKSEDMAPIVLLGIIVDASFRSDTDAASGDRAPKASGDREQDLPDWLLPCTEGVERENSSVESILSFGGVCSDHVDGVKDSNILSHGVCARDDVKLKTKEMRLCAQTMRAHVGVSVSGGIYTPRRLQ